MRDRQAAPGESPEKRGFFSFTGQCSLRGKGNMAPLTQSHLICGTWVSLKASQVVPKQFF